jgi:hypothetical protein
MPKTFEILTTVSYTSAIKVEAETLEQAKKIAVDDLYEGMNDDYYGRTKQSGFKVKEETQ